MTKKIDRFDKEYAFLSNFFPCLITYNNYEYRSTEHAYQAAKTDLTQTIEVITLGGIVNMLAHDWVASAPTPAQSKKWARRVKLKPHWDSNKVSVMRNVLELKFSIPELRAQLVATGDAELIEGNWWNDTFWGVCNGKGENMLGKLLMELRERIQNGQS